MITCAINDIEIVKALYADINGALKATPKDQTFDHMGYMQDLFKDLAEQGSPEVAAKYLQSVPRLISHAGITYFEDLDMDVNALKNLNKEFKSDNGIDTIIKTLSITPDLTAKKVQIQVKKQLENQLDELPVGEETEVHLPERFKTLSPWGGTLQTYVAIKPDEQGVAKISIEDINPEKMHMVKTFERIKEVQAMGNPTDGIVIDGKKLMFKAQNLDQFAVGENYSKLDTETQNQLTLSRDIRKKGKKVSADIAQVDQRVILIVSDEFGSPVYFDNNGNVTTEENGKLVYQFMRVVRKDGDKFTVKDIYNKEDQVISPQEFARMTYDPKLDGTKKEYFDLVVKMQQQEMKELYDLQEKALKNDAPLLPITSISTGIPSGLSSTEVALKDLIKMPGVSKTILGTIKTASKTGATIEEGQAVISLNGNTFALDRPHMTEDIASEIATILTDPSISIEIKKTFTDQFIPAVLDKKGATRKYSLFYSPDGKYVYFNTYQKFGFKEQDKASLNLTPEAYAKKSAEERAADKERIIQYLTKLGLPSQKGNTFMSFNNKSLASHKYLRLAPTGKSFVTQDYFEFLSGLDAKVSLINADPGFYNYVVNYTTPESVLGDMIKNASKAQVNPVTAAKNELINRIKKGETVTGKINQEFGKDTQWDVFEPNGNRISFYNYYLNKSVDRLTEADKGKDATFEYVPELTGTDGKVYTDVVKVFVDGKHVGNVATTNFAFQEQDDADFIDQPSEAKNIAETKQILTEPGAESPTNTQSAVNKIFDNDGEFDLNDSIFEGLYRKDIKKEFINPLKVKEAKRWWNSEELKPMRDLIEFGHMANIVNSDVYARFIVAGATLADTGTFGTIQVNKANGNFYQNLTVYHEAWHVFSQLFLTKEQKLGLYSELQNFTDKNGNKPYAKMSFREVEEMLAEDFRNYVKTGKAKQGAPKRNSLFRRILNMLKQFFGKALAKFQKKDIQIDSLNSPMANDLFDKLYLGQFNSYTASIDNALLYELDRGPVQVNNPREDAMSPQDGMLVVDCIDSVFSETIDDIYKTISKNSRKIAIDLATKAGEEKITEEVIAKYEPSGKSASIVTLTDPAKRAKMYDKAKEKFQEALKREQDKLVKNEKIVDVNDITTLKDLKDNAVAVMKHKKGQDKYFFLSSQVNDFTNLMPSLKKGERVRGDEYKDTIKIVGDFYTHAKVKQGKNNRPVDIVIISRLEDAEAQFQHYLKGKAKAYTELEYNQNDAPLYSSDEQDIIRNNVRILQKTLENWGDEKTGIVKYHMQNTDYEIAKAKFDFTYTEPTEDELKDENGEVIDESENNSVLENNNDLLVGKLSLQQMMSKETTYIIKSLFKVDENGNIPLNRLGFKERADFAKTFTILARAIGGERDRYKAYEKLREESAKFPEIKQLFETKYPDPSNIKNTFEYDISRQFLQDFGKPKVKYMQLFAFTENGVLDFQVKESALAIDNTINRWSNGFQSSTKTEYINKVENISSLNLKRVYDEFAIKNELDPKRQIAFAKAIGIDIEDNKNIREELEKKTDYYGLPYIFDVVKSFNELEDLRKKEPTSKFLTKQRLDYLDKFIANPIEVLRSGIPAGVLPSMKGTVKELTQLKRLAEVQTKYGYDSATTAVIRANGNMGYQEMNWSTAHAKAQALNDVTDIMQLWTDPRYNHMSYLNPAINPHTRHLKTISSMFNSSGKHIPGKSIQIIAADGFTVLNADETTDGMTTTELDPYSKFVHELHTMLLGGVAEFPRHSEKKFAYGMKLMGGIEADPVGFLTKGSDKNLYVDATMFRNGNNGEMFAIGGYLFGYMQGEFDRIKMFRGPKRDQYLRLTGYNNVVDKVDGKDIYAGEVFSAFDDILTPDTKAALYELADQQIDVDLVTYLEGTQLKKDIVRDMRNYFNVKTEELIDLYFNKFGYLSKSLFEKMGYKEEELTKDKLKQLRESDKVLLNQIIKAYMYNDWIHKYETSIIMYGDHAQWNHDKEDWSKRIPGLTSDGIGFLYDQGTVDFINEIFNKTTYASELAKETGEEYNNFVLSEKINSAVIKDAERDSIYLDDMIAAWEEEYSRIYDADMVKKLIEKDREPFEGMKEGDGMAYMTIDAYRTLHKIGRGWTLAQENLYQKIIRKEPVSISDVKDYFPVYKLHYFGAIENDMLPATAMHKFAVIPLIPGVNAKEGSQFDVLHKKMLKENVQYVTFASGSKGVALTNNGRVDDIFENDAKEVNTKLNDQGQPEVAFTLNSIYLANLKEVTVINEHYKGQLPIATQTRGIVIDNLFANGELIDEKNKGVVDEYTDAVKSYTDILREELLNDVGFEFVDGRYVGNITEFVEVIRNELKQRDTPQHLIKLVNTTEDKQLAMDLSLHPESDSIEKLLMSFVQNGLIKQKTKGEPLVQTPTTFSNGLWDSPFKAITEMDEIKKVLGTNTLAFYLKNINGRSSEMKVAIALQGDYKNLLNAKDLEGNPVGSLDRLNELIKNPDWFEKNRKALTLFGPRIPNDATNTIEAATVWHFLPEAFGNSIIVPTEIVAKAGSDFDGDKLFMSMANIDSNGEYISKGVDNFKKVFQETKELEQAGKLPTDRMSSTQLINLQKKYLQNRYKDAAVEILMLPENYAYLTKPNGTYLVDIYVDKLEKNKTGYNKYKTVSSEGPRQSAPNAKGKRKTVMSPTRAFEAIHNLYVHDANLSLEPSLGILAKLAKSHPIYKSVGAKMPAEYKLNNSLVVPMTMRFAHNTIINSQGENVISLAGERTQKGTRISDLISHNLQGVLDRAKATFPFDLKLVPEAMDVLSYMLQAGVDEEQIFLFLNHPTVVDYFENQRLMSSAIFNVVNAKTTNVKDKAASAVVNRILDGMIPADKKNLLDSVSIVKLRTVLAEMKKNPSTVIYYAKENEKGFTETTVEELINGLNDKNIDAKTISLITTDKDNVKDNMYYTKTVKLNSGADYAFATKYLSDYNLPSGKINNSVLENALDKKDRDSLQALAVFMNFFELEKQFAGMKELQSTFSPDTAKLTTVQQVFKRIKKYEALSKFSTIDQEFKEKLFKESIISSFNQDEVIVDLANMLFKLRLNPEISKFIDDTLADFDFAKIIRGKFGKGVDGEERFTNAFNNAVINFIFQNYTSNFTNSKGMFVNVPEVYKKMQVIDNPSLTTDVVIEDETIQINSKLIEMDFATKAYLENTAAENNYQKRGLDTFTMNKNPFTTLSSYYHYVIAKEVLRINNPIESLEESPLFMVRVLEQNSAEKAYESYLSERALAASYNPAYILGRTKYTYTDNLLSIVNNMSETLKVKYPILAQLSFTPNKEGVRIVQLNNRKEAQGILADDYYKQIRDLSDITIRKVNDPYENKRISEMFGLFSLMMYYQHGVGKSGSGFVKALDPARFKEIITTGSQAFLANYVNESTLKDILDTVISPVRFKNYTREAEGFKHTSAANAAPVLTQPGTETEEEFDWTEGEKTAFIKGDRVVFDDDVNLFKAYVDKAAGKKPNKFFTKNTAFSAFYNSNTGKKETMPNSAVWILNSNGYYDMVDQDPESGEVYYQNVDLLTGYEMVTEEQKANKKSPVAESLSDYTNHSGGAYGGDTFWDIIGREFGVTEHKHYRDAGNKSLSAQLRKAGIEPTVLSKEEMDNARVAVENLLGKKYPDTTEGNLQVRNYYQVANSDAVYAIAELSYEYRSAAERTAGADMSLAKKVKGGTNTAVQLGITLNKPTYVWDISSKKWHQWDSSKNEFVEVATPTLTKNFAGVGSRDIESYNVKDREGNWVPRPQYKGIEVEEAAKQAIRDVYEKTIAEKPQTEDDIINGLETNSSGFVTGPVMNGFRKIEDITGAEIYEGNVFNKNEADSIERKLKEEFPKELAKPEQEAGNKWTLKSIYYGPIPYSYASLTRPATPMPAWLTKTVREVEKRMGVVPGYFDTALINMYNDKNTKLGMHTDAEPNLVGKDKKTNPTVLTLSFGANRVFRLEGIKDFKGNGARILTKHGNVLVMGKDSQFNYLHGIEQGTGEDGTRYSITLRHTPDVNPITTSQSNIQESGAIATDMQVYQALVAKNKGVSPKSFMSSNRKYILNRFGNYDLVDKDSGEIYMKNFNMNTGEQEEEPSQVIPVDSEIIRKEIEQIEALRKSLNLDEQLAELGYDINDIIDNLAKAKTVEDYNKIKEILNKLC